ncbi:hypothetical protein TNCV_2330381 [Trichonephila clavipes]|nr:hypothetical protein TNCV_2330381 [Trichonephila clavipes]
MRCQSDGNRDDRLYDTTPDDSTDVLVSKANVLRVTRLHFVDKFFETAIAVSIFVQLCLYAASYKPIDRYDDAASHIPSTFEVFSCQ